MGPVGNEIFYMATDGPLGATLGELGLLETWDISDLDAPVNLAVINTLGGPTKGIAVSGSTIAASFLFTDAVRLVDASDPNNPMLRGTISGNSETIYLEGNSLFILSSGQIRAYDISNLDAPSLLGSSAGPASPKDIQIVGNHMYVADSSFGLRVYDVSNPAAISEIGQLNAEIGATAITINGATAAIAGPNSALLIDVTNPSLPVALGTANNATLSGISDALLQNGQLYLSYENGVQVFDISDPNTPTYQRTIAGPEILSDPTLTQSQGEIILSGSRRLVVSKGDLSGPMSSTISNTLPTGLPATVDFTAIAVQDGFGYAVNTDAGSLVVLDLSDPQLSTLVGSLPIGSNLADDIVLSGNHAFLMHDAALISVVDISTPSAPTLLATWDATPTGAGDWSGNLGLELVGSTLYVCPQFGGFVAYDITNPVVPTLIAQEPWGGGGSPQNIAFAAKDDRAAVIYRTGGGGSTMDTIRGINIATPSSPFEIGSESIISGDLSNGSLQILNQTAYATGTSDYQAQFRCSFMSFDLSTSTTLLSTTNFASPFDDATGGPRFESFVIANGIAYVPFYERYRSRAISAFDVSDPSSLVYLGSSGITDENTALKGAFADGDRLYTVGGTTGRVGVFDISGCQPPCPADFTGDGNLNFFDVSAFLAAFAAQDPAADFTGDGDFNFFDVSAFLKAFAAGCP